MSKKAEKRESSAMNGCVWHSGPVVSVAPPPPPIPPAPPAPPRPPQPASDRQELIRRFAVAIVTTGKCFPWPVIWRMATELADAEPRVDGREGTA